MSKPKTIDTLVSDIYEVLAASREGRAGNEAVTEEVRKAFESACGKVLLRAAGSNEKKVRKPKTLYCSEIGHPCQRKLWYKVRPEMFTSEVMNPAALLKFTYGDLIEELVLSLAEVAGHKVEMRQEPVRFDLKDGWAITGRIDAIIDGVLVDVKSASQQSFTKFEDPAGLMKDDPFGYVLQLATYFSKLAPEGKCAIDRAGFLAVDKVLGKMVAPMYGFNKPLDDVFFNQLVDIAASPTVPDRPAEATPVEATKKKDKLCTMCSYCEYKEHCWQDANEGIGIVTEILSGRPRHIVKGCEVTAEI